MTREQCVVILSVVMSIDDSLPTDLASAHALIMAQREALVAAQARATAAESEAQYRALLIEKLKYTIRKLRHERYGQSSERGALLEQLELQLADLEEDASQAETAARMATAAATSEKIVVPSFERRRPARRPLPEHLPRERIVYPVPSACPCCGGGILRKIGEDVTETLELIPRQWKVIQHVREKFSCRACEAITQPPAPSHPIARGRAGPKLLAHVLFSKYCLHLPLNRQSATYAREGIDLDVSTLADWVGAAAATLMPLVTAILMHVVAGERIHADDTTVPVLAKGKTRTGRLWTYVRDDRPFAGPDPPAAVFFYSRDRGGEHPEQHLAKGFSGRGESGIPKGRPGTDSMRIDSPGGGPCAERIPVRCECESLDLWRRERRGVRPPNSWRSARVLRLDGCSAGKRTERPGPSHAEGASPRWSSTRNGSSPLLLSNLT